MNEMKRAATLMWMLNQTMYGELPESLDDESRQWAVALVTALQKHLKQKPEQLAQITQGELEGEFNGKD